MDCDPGHDDAIALLLASRADAIKIIGVTTVCGNSELKNTSVNALKVLDYADVHDVPVYAGCNKPMMQELFRLTGVIIHGENGLGGPNIPSATRSLETEHAVPYLIRTLRNADEKITLIVTGPMTNIATAFVTAPEIKEHVEEIIIMGGAINEAGNITSAAEFNVYVDPEAAKIVVNSGCKITLVTLDVTMKAVFYEKDINRIKQNGDKVSTLVGELLDFFGNTHVDHFGFMACPIHDALCVGILIDPTLIEFQQTNLDISVADPLTRGETVADIWDITGKPHNARVSMKVDREKFVNMIVEHMKKPYVAK